MDAILGLITGDVGRYVLSLVGGRLLKQWPAFTNKGIPLALYVLNALLAIVNGLAVPMAHAAGSDQPAWYASLGMTLVRAGVTWLLAIGTHSAAKNTLEGVHKGV